MLCPGDGEALVARRLTGKAMSLTVWSVRSYSSLKNSWSNLVSEYIINNELVEISIVRTKQRPQEKKMLSSVSAFFEKFSSTDGCISKLYGLERTTDVRVTQNPGALFPQNLDSQKNYK